MGGMLAATFLAIFFVPLFFKLITDRHLTREALDRRDQARGRAGPQRDAQARTDAAPRAAPAR